MTITTTARLLIACGVLGFASCEYCEQLESFAGRHRGKRGSALYGPSHTRYVYHELCIAIHVRDTLLEMKHTVSFVRV